MTPTPPRIPPASLHEEWSVASVQRLAQAMGRPATAPDRGLSAVEKTGGNHPLDPVRRARRLAALRRLAADAAATPAERALAAQRLARFDPVVHPFAC